MLDSDTLRDTVDEIGRYPGLTDVHATSNNDYAVEEAEYRGKTIRFFRDDFSFTSLLMSLIISLVKSSTSSNGLFNFPPFA